MGSREDFIITLILKLIECLLRSKEDDKDDDKGEKQLPQSTNLN